MTPSRYACSCCLVAATLASACQSPPAQDPEAIDWSSYEEAPAPAPPVQSAPPIRAAPQAPHRIPVRRGQEPPPGYVELRGPNWGYVALGLGVFAGFYVPPALVAAPLQGNAWTMQVPFVGPFLQMGATVEHFEGQGGPGGGLFGYIGVGYYFVFLAALGACQVGGVVLSTVGLFQRHPRWVRAEHALIDTPSFGMQLRLTPASMQLTGRF